MTRHPISPPGRQSELILNCNFFVGKIQKQANKFRPGVALTLAEFERQLGNDGAAARMFEHAIQVGDDSAPVHHACGLHLVRVGQRDAALKHLKRSTELDTSEPQFLYVYGIASNSLGRPDDAITILKDGHDNFPEQVDSLVRSLQE